MAVRCALVIGFGLAAASPALAQFGIARLSQANGGVTRQHYGAPAATTLDVSLMDGDEIGTTDGRAEITFHDGAVVHLDRHTRIVINARERLQVLDGRAFLRTSGVKPFFVETSGGKMRVMPASVVEVTTKAENRDVLLRVIGGWARMESPWGSEQITAYHTTIVSGATSRPIVTKWVPSQTDEFERWTLTRTVLATSTDTGSAFPNYGPPYGGWYYSSPAYVYYPGYVHVSPVYVTPYYYGTSYVTPYYSSSYYSGSSSYYSNPYGSYYRYSYSAYREPVYQWRTSSPAPSSSVPRATLPSSPAAPGAVAGVRIPK